MRLTVILEQCEEGGYTAHVPSLPGCISEGDTIDEAVENMKEAVQLYLEDVDEDYGSGEGVTIRELVV